MTPQEFYVLYNGQEVSIDLSRHYWVGENRVEIVGFNDQRVAVRTINATQSINTSPLWKTAHIFWFPPSGLIPLYPQIKNKEAIQDDCLECGAIGNEPCKDGCRNKD